MKSSRIATIGALVLVSVLFGLGYAGMVLKALFVFREDEPRIHLLALLGPAFLLPGGIFAAFKPKIGGSLLMLASAVSSLGAIPAMEFDLSSILRYVALFCAPVFIIGAAFRLVGAPVTPKTSGVDT